MVQTMLEPSAFVHAVAGRRSTMGNTDMARVILNYGMPMHCCVGPPEFTGMNYGLGI